MMEEPILEALNFSLDSDLRVDEGGSSSSGLYNSSSSCSSQNPSILKLTQSILCSNSKSLCPFPNCSLLFLSVDENRESILKHFLVDHKFIIDDVGHIANLHKYLIHWKDRFENNPLEEFCAAFWMDSTMTPDETSAITSAPDFKPNEGQGTNQQSEDRVKYFFLSGIIQEEQELRARLWTERLETVLEVNRLEREQMDFSHQCLFCKLILKGNRTHLFRHMEEEHCFYMGQADNLVFIENLMEQLHSTLNKNICLYCGKTFKDKVVMREHMRKKLHKKINPANPIYDRYYLINYLEPGKNWKTLSEEEPEDERTEEEWLEKEESTSIVCLLCSYQSTKFDSVLSHMKTEHSFDFERLVQNCDFYQKVKMVNFIRRNIHQSQCYFCNLKFLEKSSLLSHLQNHLQQNSEFPPENSWNQAEYFFPTYENDQFLILLDRDNNADDHGMNSNNSQDTNMVIPEDM